VNATTALRHHPVESVFRDVFLLLAIFVAGTPVWLVFLYQSCSAFLSQFNHANIKLPMWLDNALQWIIVSPDMHKVHHHYQLPITDTNYGNIFSFWDRIFGTFVRKDVSELQYGLDIYPEEQAHSWLPRLLRMPFERYRAPTGSKFGEKEN
jgi:sterol desaturase/sphingolipid hydroxylase (fatty acid hydroxylase superfamily)